MNYQANSHFKNKLPQTWTILKFKELFAEPQRNGI